MGSLIGHVIPGTFFGCFSLWWMYNVLLRYYVSARVAGEGGGAGRGQRFIGYYSTATFPCSRSSRVHVEGILKVVVIIIGITVEVVGIFKDDHFNSMVKAQHITMYFFFGLNGVVDLLVHHRAPLPAAFDYVSGILAFSMEGFLFLYHLHGRDPMNVQLHMLLVYVVCGNTVALLTEMIYRRSVLPALARCYFTLLQCSWFYQVGFILYPAFGDPWDQDSHEQMMLVTLIFCWHNAIAFMLMMVLALLIQARVKALAPSAMYQALHPLTASASSSTHSTRLSKMDSEQVRRIIDESEEEDV